MIGGGDLSSKLALDAQGLNELKLGAKQSSPEALKAAAQQFEAVFMNMLMKSMREAAPQDGMFDSEQTRMYTSMLDQQLTQRMASRGIGLADVMVRQLSSALTAPPGGEAKTPDAGMATPGFILKAPPDSPLKISPNLLLKTTPDIKPQAGLSPNAPVSVTQSPNVPVLAAPPSTAAATRVSAVAPHVEVFVQRLLPHAQAASVATGIPARFMLGQAALETGWGRAEIRAADGQNSHNLFGIKAGGAWRGRTMDVVTTEFVNGKPHKQVESFRAYDSYADAFRDYATMLRANPRYQNGLAQAQDAAGCAQGLQQAGYATDPNYANKLMRVIRQVELT